MSNDKLVSIIIPTYNQSEFLKSAIKTVINQTYGNWEAIIINNYSQDNTIQILEGFKDERIKFYNYNNYGIIASSRNYGIKKSLGDYIAFLDSDDLWYEDKLTKSIDLLEKGFDLTFHNEIWKWSDGTAKNIKYGPEKSIYFEELLFKGNRISTSTVVVRKDILKEVSYFDESKSIIGNEDYDLWMRISLKKNIKIKMINDYLGYYRIHGKNSSKRIFKQLISEIKVIRNNFKRLSNKKLFYYFRLIIRLSKSLLGSLLKVNSYLYKVSIFIRK